MGSDFVSNSFAEVCKYLRRANYTKNFGEFIPGLFGGVFTRHSLQDLQWEAQ